MPSNSYFGEFNVHHMPFALLPYHCVTASPLASIMATTAATSHHQSRPRPPPPWCIQTCQVGFFFPFFKFYFTNPGQCLHIDCDLHLLIPPPSSSLHQNGLTPRCGLVDPILLVVTDAERIWWSEYVLCICTAHSSYWSDYFWRNLINSIVQMSKGANRIIVFDRKLFFSCLLWSPFSTTAPN